MGKSVDGKHDRVLCGGCGLDGVLSHDNCHRSRKRRAQVVGQIGRQRVIITTYGRLRRSRDGTVGANGHRRTTTGRPFAGCNRSARHSRPYAVRVRQRNVAVMLSPFHSRGQTALFKRFSSRRSIIIIIVIIVRASQEPADLTVLDGRAGNRMVLLFPVPDVLRFFATVGVNPDIRDRDRNAAQSTPGKPFTRTKYWNGIELI